MAWVEDDVRPQQSANLLQIRSLKHSKVFSAIYIQACGISGTAVTFGLGFGDDAEEPEVCRCGTGTDGAEGPPLLPTPLAAL